LAAPTLAGPTLAAAGLASDGGPLRLDRAYGLDMDDYGNGYSGLQRLHTLAIGAVYVDRCLIDACRQACEW
jgi:hypothetical protein